VAGKRREVLSSFTSYLSFLTCYFLPFTCHLSPISFHFSSFTSLQKLSSRNTILLLQKTSLTCRASPFVRNENQSRILRDKAAPTILAQCDLSTIYPLSACKRTRLIPHYLQSFCAPLLGSRQLSHSIPIRLPACLSSCRTRNMTKGSRMS
jgi:hypothetical protein